MRVISSIGRSRRAGYMRLKNFSRIGMVLLLALILTAPATAQSKIRLEGSPPETNGVEFATDKPLVATYFFYWYDYPTKAHILNPNKTDALLRHPIRFDGTFSFENDYWYLREFKDMTDAGIDIVLPVYWGNGRYPECEPWARKGLGHITRVLDAMQLQGTSHPAVGMFYDTTTLMYTPENGFNAANKPDLTTDPGKETMFLTIESFFDGIPPRHWALYGGKPIIWLYSAVFAKEFDATLFPALKSLFSNEYGVEPYIVADKSWEGAGEADAWYSWGAAIDGVSVGKNVIGVGAGYDDSPVPGRERIVVDRLDGLFYERNWLKALEMNPPIVALETWNELHEGTEICETRELGRKYIDLTREYINILKLQEKEREKVVKNLLELYNDIVILKPVEVSQADLEAGKVEFPIDVVAHSRNIYGQIKWVNAGEGVIIKPTDDDFTLRKGEIFRLDYTVENLSEKTMMGQLPYASGAFAIDGRERPVQFRMPLSLVRRIECAPAGREMKIDGDLSDWTGKNALIIAQPANAGGPKAPYPLENTGAGYPAWHPGDLSMEVYSCWDAENLYLAVVVRDDIPLDGFKDRDMFQGDSIQVGIEMDDDRNGIFDPDKDMMFGLTQIAGKAWFYAFRRPANIGGPLDGIIRYAVQRTGTSTVYELSIPVAEFDIDENAWIAGYTVGFDVAAHDDDGAGWDGFIGLSPGLVYGHDTRRFARLVLVEK